MNIILNSFASLSIKISQGFKKYSPGVTAKRKIKERRNDPNYKLAVSIRKKRVNLKKDQLFPINLPLKLRYVYKPLRNQVNLTNRTEFINFKEMEGNEILINLQNAQYLRLSELASGLNCLSKLKKPENIDWNKHEWIANCVAIAKKKTQHFRWRELAVLSVALHRLGIEDEELWKSIEFHTNKMIHKYYANAFGKNFLILMNRPQTSQEFRERLVSLLPIHLTKMNQDLIVEIYTLLNKQNLMTEYLFDDHFHQIFWRRNKWFGVYNMSKIVDQFIELKRYDEPFIFDVFLQKYNEMIEDLNEKECEIVIDTITKLKEFNPKFEQPYNELMEKLPARLQFCQGNLKTWENSLLYKIVQSDLEFYRQREKAKLEEQAKSS